MDRFFRSHPGFLMFRYKDATSVRRPAEYADGDTADDIVVIPKSRRGQTGAGGDLNKEEIFEERIE
jgi:hypothetical protein